jgi:hypothetical protein
MMSVARAAWRRTTKAYRARNGSAKEPKIALPPRRISEPARSLAVVAIVKNESRYLREWIEFQRLMGAEHVYLYNNESTDDFAKVVVPYVAEGFVSVTPWASFDTEVSPQLRAYAHAICNFGPQFRWMAFIDLDEFLFPVSAPNLVETLSRYEDCPGLCVPWFMFGFSGHDEPPAGLVIESYTQRAPYPPPPDRQPLVRWKSIVQPAAVVGLKSAHLFDLASGITGGVDERRVLIMKGRQKEPSPGAVLRINHYYTRSRQEFTAKLNLKRFTKGHSDHNKKQILADMIEAGTVHDDTILRFLPALRERMLIRLDTL